MFAGKRSRIVCASISGANVQRNDRNGCAATAPMIDGCDSPNHAPTIVTSTPAKTSRYVRRTSVARSAPVRTAVVAPKERYETPIVRLRVKDWRNIPRGRAEVRSPRRVEGRGDGGS